MSPLKWRGYITKLRRKLKTLSNVTSNSNLVPPSLNTSGNLSVDMFDYCKGEDAIALGFEPVVEGSEKPEISVMKLSDYTQVPTSTPPVSTTVSNSTLQGTIDKVTQCTCDVCL